MSNLYRALRFVLFPETGRVAGELKTFCQRKARCLGRANSRLNFSNANNHENQMVESLSLTESSSALRRYRRLRWRRRRHFCVPNPDPFDDPGRNLHRHLLFSNIR